MVLMGLGEAAQVGPSAGILGEAVGLRFFHELPEGAKGARGPWAWIAYDEVVGWCRERGQRDDRVFTIGW